MKIRKLAAFLLSLTLAFPLHVTASAAAGGAEEAADTLYSLGLFQGTEIGAINYELDRPLTRQEAIVMLLRLLGKEDEAKTGAWENPFPDVADWATPHVAYAYAHGLTTGTGDGSTFSGGDPITASQYITFVLRAMGYSSGVDFRWDAAWELSDSLGLTHGAYHAANNDVFLRGDAAMISHAALDLPLKGTGATLISKLVEEGAVPAQAAAAAGYAVVGSLPAWSHDEATGEYRFPTVSGGVSTAHLRQAFPEAVYYSNFNMGAGGMDNALSLVPDKEDARFYKSAFELYLCYTTDNMVAAPSLLTEADLTVDYGDDFQEDRWLYLYDENLDCVAQFVSSDGDVTVFTECGRSARALFEELDARYARAMSGCVPGSVRYEPMKAGSNIQIITDSAGVDVADLRCGELFIYKTAQSYAGMSQEAILEYELKKALYEMFYVPGSLYGGYGDNGNITWENYWFSPLTELTPRGWNAETGDEYGFGLSEDHPDTHTYVVLFYDSDGNFISYDIY